MDTARPNSSNAYFYSESKKLPSGSGNIVIQDYCGPNGNKLNAAFKYGDPVAQHTFSFVNNSKGLTFTLGNFGRPYYFSVKFKGTFSDNEGHTYNFEKWSHSPTAGTSYTANISIGEPIAVESCKWCHKAK